MIAVWANWAPKLEFGPSWLKKASLRFWHFPSCPCRRRFSKALARAQGGRPTEQLGDDSEFAVEDYQENALHDADFRDAWRGLLLMVKYELSPEDDVIKLLSVLEQHPDIFEEASGTRWPVQTLIQLLDRFFAPPNWSNDRVDNAKRRLTNWIKRLMQKNGLDAIDLEDLFARVARQEDREKGPIGTGSRPAILHS